MVQPRRVNGSAKNKTLLRNNQQQQQAETVAVPSSKNHAKNTDRKPKKEHNPVSNKRHNKDQYYNPYAERKVEQLSVNPNLTKKDLKMIEKIHAKMEYHEIRDEFEELDKLRAKILDIESNANLKALKKEEKLAAAAYCSFARGSMLSTTEIPFSVLFLPRA